jgi:hypothetical protein
LLHLHDWEIRVLLTALEVQNAKTAKNIEKMKVKAPERDQLIYERKLLHHRLLGEKIKNYLIIKEREERDEANRLKRSEDRQA